MRSFFKKPSWASRGDEGTDLNFYRHAGQVYNDIITANRKARASRLSIEHALEHETEHENSKRRRLSCAQQSTKSSSGSLTPNEAMHNVEQPLYSNACYEHVQETNNNNNNNDNSRQSGRLSSYGISVGIATETDVQYFEPQPDMEHIPGETSCEHPKVAKGFKGNKKAFSRESLRQDSGDVVATVTPHNHSLAPKEPIVQILITSRIPNTRPLIVRRKTNQSLKDVRLAWCNRQHFNKEMQDSVFLTWKGKRLFDVTTCRSLGVHRKSGNMTEYDTFQLDAEDIQVHMEACTEVILNADLHPSPTVTNQRSSPEFTCWNEVTSSSDKLILTCPGFDDLKVKLDLEMRVSELVATFRAARQIPATRDIHLVFDGDRLEYQAYLADYELLDNDLVEVRVK